VFFFPPFSVWREKERGAKTRERAKKAKAQEKKRAPSSSLALTFFFFQFPLSSVPFLVKRWRPYQTSPAPSSRWGRRSWCVALVSRALRASERARERERKEKAFDFNRKRCGVEKIAAAAKGFTPFFPRLALLPCVANQLRFAVGSRPLERSLQFSCK